MFFKCARKLVNRE